jgi:hypothetical protein
VFAISMHLKYFIIISTYSCANCSLPVSFTENDNVFWRTELIMDSQNKSEGQTLQDFFDKEKLTVNRRKMLEQLRAGDYSEVIEEGTST